MLRALRNWAEEDGFQMVLAARDWRGLAFGTGLLVTASLATARAAEAQERCPDQIVETAVLIGRLKDLIPMVSKDSEQAISMKLDRPGSPPEVVAFKKQPDYLWWRARRTLEDADKLLTVVRAETRPEFRISLTALTRDQLRLTEASLEILTLLGPESELSRTWDTWSLSGQAASKAGSILSCAEKQLREKSR